MKRTLRQANAPLASTLLLLAVLVPGFFGAAHADVASPVPQPPVGIERLDPSLDALIAPDAVIEQLASGFSWAEGPVWRAAHGDLLFSDVPRNTIYRWRADSGLTVFLRPSGYSGANPPGRELGSNGLTLDRKGALLMADHGNRLVARLNDILYTKITIAERFQGKRFNSPNDLVVRRNGDVYFTDPPFGLRGLNQDPAKELAVSGVYRVAATGAVSLLSDALEYPNGIAFSPDERTLYVSNADGARAIWMAYEIRADGSLGAGRVFFDATALAKAGRRGVPDGMRVDVRGNLFAAGPGGILILSPQGKHLGTIITGQPTANCTFGDDGSTLYMTANDRLMRVRLRTRGDVR